VEIEGLNSVPRFSFDDRRQIREIAAECEKQGLRVVSVHGPGVPYNSADEGERKEAVKKGLEALRVAVELGASVFVIHARGIDEPSLKSVCETLEGIRGLPIKLTLETPTWNPRGYPEFLAKIGSEQVGMTVDTGHVRNDDGLDPFCLPGQAYDTLKFFGDRICHLHLSDFHMTDHVPCFTGNIQWPELFRALADIEYAGIFMFEFGPSLAGRPKENAAEERLEQIAQTLAPDFVAEALSGPHEVLIKRQRQILRPNPESPEDVLRLLSDFTPQTPVELRDMLFTVLLHFPRKTIRDVFGATTDRLLESAARFPEQLEAKCREFES